MSSSSPFLLSISNPFSLTDQKECGMKKLRIAGLLGILLVVGVAGLVVQAQDDFSLNAAFG